ncbi:hypothetical protein HBN76_17940 [Pseudomonas sp. WS 5013]|jgi:hypothetical protein|uniref:hypothetical protein n=1 Tax=Pseudomonas sp. WS 5013 TaxID=2717475 RepID=UPI001474F224|nr:hypothetical protein [Pseudomonas sp. WS 5013]NMY43201.1 hypothetical protein [Pseudomonas sp. WS 5013]
MRASYTSSVGLFLWGSLVAGAVAEPASSSTGASRIQKVPWLLADKPAHRNDEYYTALFNETDAVINSASECIDTGVLSWLRKLVKKDSAEITFIAKVTPPGGSTEKAVPLFSYGKSEKMVEGQHKCNSFAYSGQITPWIKADANKSYAVNISYGVSDLADVSAARNISALADKMAAISIGTNGFMVKKLAGERFDSLAADLDKNVSEHLAVTSLSSNRIELDSVPRTDMSGGATIRYVRFVPGDIKAGPGGVEVVKGKVQFTLGLRVIRSLFADETGKYLGWPAVLASNLAGAERPSQGTLKALMDEGVGGVSGSSLARVSSSDDARIMCSNLTLELAKGFTEGDVAIAKYSILNHYSPQIINTGSLRDLTCFDSRDVAALSVAGISLPEVVREDKKRNDEVQRRQNALFRAIRSGDVKNVEKLAVSNKEILRFRDLSAEPSQVGKALVTGDAVLPVLVELGTGMSYGCYQAPPAGALNQIGAVINLRGARLGVISYYSADGLLAQMTIGSVEEIGLMAGLGEGFPSQDCTI